MPQTPFLFVLVDAVPYDIARRAWMAGAFPGFPPPSRMVSTFPSLTYVAIPALIRGIHPFKPKGYEAVWFDPERGVLVRDFEHMTPSGLESWPRMGLVQEGFLYALPRGFTFSQTRWITQQALQHADEPWMGWISATDALGHFKGRAALARAFESVARKIALVREEYTRIHGTLPRVVLASDHGLECGTRFHLSEDELLRFLALGGYHGIWGAPDGVATASLGMVGSGVLHTHPDRAPAVAELVAQASGVDLAVAKVPDGAVVCGVRMGGMARARIHWEGDRYRYEPINGDPLECAALEGRWWTDTESFEQTAHLKYPDAWRRIRDALEGGICRVPATVIFAMETGWTYGPVAIHAGATLVGGMMSTHGALHAEQSCGFVMDSAGRLPPFLRPWEVSNLLAGRLAPGQMVGAALPWHT
ncbi:MAG: hypothetical protein JXB39_06140 [Deltaproteobacteria bacterium]|nr:hypothetical protein [Deltaproteobacteria bacterium]